MKILAPVNSVKEAKILSELGAEELYCGLSERAWRKSHGQDFWLSRRGPGNANVESLKELHKLVVVAHKAGSQVLLSMNKWISILHRYGQSFVVKRLTYCCRPSNPTSPKPSTHPNL